MNNQIELNDMYNVFRSFKISKDLYLRWRDYAKTTKLSMNKALTQLLHSCPSGCYYNCTGQDTKWWYSTDKNYMTFNLELPKPLLVEIFNIFEQTQYKNQSLEMNSEILKRLDYALRMKGY